MRKYKLLALIPFVLSGQKVFAQTEGGSMSDAELSLYILIGMVFLVALIVLAVAWNVYGLINTLMQNEARLRAEKAGTEYVPEPSLWSQMMQSWTDSVPIEEEKSIELDHEYDGIRELDNHLPPWWLALFYGSIIFGAIYLFGYHVADWWPLQEEEYEIALAEAAAAQEAAQGDKPTYDESTITYNGDEGFLAAGKKIYGTYCAACHREDGGGMAGLGPNLTDAYWIHGGSIKDIFLTVTNGVQENGMAAWDKTLTGEQRAQVSSYVYSLFGSNPADAREAQGQLHEREEELTEEAVAADSTAVDSSMEMDTVEVIEIE